MVYNSKINWNPTNMWMEVIEYYYNKLINNEKIKLKLKKYTKVKNKF